MNLCIWKAVQLFLPLQVDNYEEKITYFCCQLCRENMCIYILVSNQPDEARWISIKKKKKWVLFYIMYLLRCRCEICDNVFAQICMCVPGFCEWPLKSTWLEMVIKDNWSTKLSKHHPYWDKTLCRSSWVIYNWFEYKALLLKISAESVNINYVNQDFHQLCFNRFPQMMTLERRDAPFDFFKIVGYMITES